MGEIIGLGCTHYPGLTLPDERLPAGFHHLLTAPNVPAHYKDRANWPTELLAELGNDAGVSSARRYGARLGDDFRTIRRQLDDFNPDLVLIWATTSMRISARTSSRRSASWASTMTSS
jgi:hypothetical protein